jgi:hypothetical protein
MAEVRRRDQMAEVRGRKDRMAGRIRRDVAKLKGNVNNVAELKGTSLLMRQMSGGRRNKGMRKRGN